MTPAAGGDRLRPGRDALLLVAATPLVYALALALRARWLLPALLGGLAWWSLRRSLARGARGRAAADLLVWAAATGVVATVGPVLAPRAAEETVLNGPAYRDEMRAWIATGAGREGSPRRFLPEHALHLGLFALAALATGGLAALAFGVALMDYMGFYVASLVRDSPSPVLAALAGWHPWALLRVTGYVLLGSLLSEPLLRGRDRPPLPRARLAAAALLLLADVLLKALLAERWRRLLASLLAA